MKIVILSPHRSDAAFSLSLAIEAWIAQGHSIEIINCFTRSAFAPFSDAGSLHPNDRASYATAVRLREDETWSRRFSKRITLTDLNLKDAPIRLRCSHNELFSLPVNPTEKSVEKIRKALEQARTDALLLPLALGNHIDHRTAQHAALLVPAARLAFYEDLPDAAHPGIAEDIEAAVHAIDPALQPTFASTPGDRNAATQRKRKFALCYDSQIDDATASDIASFCTHYEGRERLWANALWHASARLGADKLLTPPIPPHSPTLSSFAQPCHPSPKAEEPAFVLAVAVAAAGAPSFAASPRRVGSNKFPIPKNPVILPQSGRTCFCSYPQPWHTQLAN